MVVVRIVRLRAIGGLDWTARVRCNWDDLVGIAVHIGWDPAPIVIHGRIADNLAGVCVWKGMGSCGRYRRRSCCVSDTVVFPCAVEVPKIDDKDQFRKI